MKEAQTTEEAKTTVLETQRELLRTVLSLGHFRLANRLVCLCWDDEISGAVADIKAASAQAGEGLLRTFPNLATLRYCVLGAGHCRGVCCVMGLCGRSLHRDGTGGRQRSVALGAEGCVALCLVLPHTRLTSLK